MRFNFTLQILSEVYNPEEYERFLQFLQTPAISDQMWRDAEHRVSPGDPSKTWAVVSHTHEGLRELSGHSYDAWCSWHFDEAGVLVCGDNYERRGPGRRLGLYRLAYRARHIEIVHTWPGPAVTYLFPGEVVDLHEKDGWHATGTHGDGEVKGHVWDEFIR